MNTLKYKVDYEIIVSVVSEDGKSYGATYNKIQEQYFKYGSSALSFYTEKLREDDGNVNLYLLTTTGCWKNVDDCEIKFRK